MIPPEDAQASYEKIESLRASRSDVSVTRYIVTDMVLQGALNASALAMSADLFVTRETSDPVAIHDHIEFVLSSNLEWFIGALLQLGWTHPALQLPEETSNA